MLVHVVKSKLDHRDALFSSSSIGLHQVHSLHLASFILANQPQKLLRLQSFPWGEDVQHFPHHPWKFSSTALPRYIHSTYQLGKFPLSSLMEMLKMMVLNKRWLWWYRCAIGVAIIQIWSIVSGSNTKFAACLLRSGAGSLRLWGRLLLRLSVELLFKFFPEQYKCVRTIYQPRNQA